MTPALADIRIVLVEPSHPGNIGASARALKNMALEQLVLVRPRSFPDPEASARASGAHDVLERARVHEDLAEALEDCGFVIATTSRERDQYFRVLDLRDAAARIVEEAQRGPVAVLFGNERVGLSNEQLQSAHALLRIPGNPLYCSLNLGMAVQLVTYEIYRARGGRHAPAPAATPLAPAAELERLYEHLQQVLEEIDFRDRTTSGRHLMNRLRRLIQRAEPDVNEVSILRGILSAVQQKRRAAGEPRS